MDVYCPRCGEPYDIDHFHDVAMEENLTFEEVRKNFTKKGCSAVGGSQCEQTHNVVSDISAAAFDLMGDDIDGVASMMDDAKFLGMF